MPAVPKKTRRGGTYTTGIKRTPSGGYGGQTTGRRGCFGMILTGAFIVAGSAVAAVCTLAMGVRGML